MAKKRIDKESFDDFLKRNYGQGVITPASQIIERKRDILKTVLSLDIALNGGIPEGVTCLISGKAKAGKTTLCLQILKNAIDNNRPAFYVDIERRCNQRLIETIEALDASKLKVVKSTPDKIFSCEDWLRIIERIIKDNKKAVVVVDSLALLSTLAEQSEEIGNSKDMAGAPKLLASFFRKMQQTIDDNDSILIFISQLMSNRNPTGPKFSEKGGMSILYANSVWINTNWVKKWERDVQTNAPAGHDIQVDIQCSALGPPFMPCSIPLRYGKGIDLYKDIASNAENVGLIEKNGAWYTIPMFDEKLQGMNSVHEYLKNNKEKSQILEDKIREMLLKNGS